MEPDRYRLTRLNGLPRWFVVVLAGPPALFLAVFYVWPFATLLARGLRPDVLIDVVGDTRSTLWFTLWQAALSTMLTLAIGLAPTWAVARFTFPGRRLLVGLLTAVFVLPTVVVGAAFVALLPERVERGVGAIVAAHVVFNLAVVVRLVGARWRQLPADVEHVAATLGASPTQVLRHVTLPLLRPAVVAAAAVVFVFTFTSFGVIRVLGATGRPTIEVEVWRRATQLGDIAGAAALAVLQLVVLGGAVWWSAHIGRRSPTVAMGPADPLPRPRRDQLTWVALAAGGTAAIVLAPLVALVARSLRTSDGYSLTAWRTLGDTELRPGLRVGVDPLDALTRSATTAVWATLFALALGAGATLAIDALGRSGALLDTGLMLPLGTSAVTVGFGMLITFDTSPVDWRAQWWLVPVGHALVAVPFVVRTGLGALRGLDRDLRHAAATLGASPIRAWATTTLPVLRRPLVVGVGMAAAISLGEFGATTLLSRTGADTLPIAIERLLSRTGQLFQAQAFALAAMLAAATVAIVLAVDRIGEWEVGSGAER